MTDNTASKTRLEEDDTIYDNVTTTVSSRYLISSHLPADVMVTNRQRNASCPREREDLVDHHWIAENCGVEKEDAHFDVIEGVGYNLAHPVYFVMSHIAWLEV